MEKRVKLFLNMIIGDFEPVDIVKRSIDSVRDSVDGIYVTVTYKDGVNMKDSPLITLLKEYKVNISYFKWTKNFSEARNFSMAEVPKGKGHFIYWQDADDILANSDKLHQVADEMPANNQSAIFFDYWYQVDLNKDDSVREVIVKHKRERIIKHDGSWKWIGGLHETLINQQQENVIRHYREECHVVHMTNDKRLDANINRNIDILEKNAREESHSDPRTLIYLAKAYFDKAKMAKDEKDRKIPMDLSLNLFNEYLSGSGKPGQEGYQERSGWKDERSTAWSYIAEIAILSKHPEAAIGAYQNAIDEAPQFPNYYIDMAMCYVVLDEFEKAKHWLLIGSRIPEPNTTIIQFPREIKSRALETAFHIHMHYNELEKALKIAEQLIKLFPDDAFAKERLETVKKLWAYNRTAQSFVFISKYLESINQKDKIATLLRVIPRDMKKEKFAAEMAHLFAPIKKWKDNEIAIICGPGFEEWDPNSIKTGVGGSEEAVIRMSNELRELGWKITVFANPREEKSYNGVQYKKWHNINYKDEFNALILWRNIGFLDVAPKAKFILLWLHDVPNNPDFTEERVARVDKIAVLSEYHKSLLRMQDSSGAFIPIPAEKIFLTSNGIPELKGEWKGNPTRMFYASSPDRGLPYLLNAWPQIRKEVPDAELHIYYGFEIYDVIHANNPARVQWKNEVLQMMKQDGIIYHGRVGHDALHREIAKSGIWAYPTDFTEISCITAMKAQALGAIPVVTNFAALEETVKNGLRVDVDIITKEGRKEYFNSLVELLKDPKKQQEIRKQMVPWAREYFSWKNVADSWDKMLRINLQNPTKKYETKPETIGKLKKNGGDSNRPNEPILSSVNGTKQRRNVGNFLGNVTRNRKNKKVSGTTDKREGENEEEGIIIETKKGKEVKNAV